MFSAARHGGSTGITQYHCYRCERTVSRSPSSFSTNPRCAVCHLGFLEQLVHPDLPIVKIDKEMLDVMLNSDNNSQCVVCIEEFKVDDVAKEMPCNHIYHEGCIDMWLDRNNSCPICRFELLTEPRASRGEGSSGGEEFDDEGEGVDGWPRNRFASRGWEIERGTTRGGEGSSGGRQAREEEEEEGVEDPSRNWLRRPRIIGTLQP